MKTFTSATGLSIAILLLSSASASTARAQTAAPPLAATSPEAPTYPSAQPAPDPGSHVHDRVYTRLTLGGGYTRLSSNVAGAGIVISGGSVALGVAVGGAITDHLILYGELTVTSIVNPTFSGGGMSVSGTNITAGSNGLGAGVAYYLEPENFYLAGTLLANQIELDDSSGTLGKSEFGVGLEGLAAKEWWVSDNWGLGVAGQLLWASMKDNDNGILTGVQGRWTTLSFSLLFSATYN
jgi:hypothetical protein